MSQKKVQKDKQKIEAKNSFENCYCAFTLDKLVNNGNV